MRKYILKQINTQYNWLQNNTARFYFILERAELGWNFSSIPKDGCDIPRFQTVHMVGTHFLLENLWISQPSLGVMEKFQPSSALSNIK